MMKSLSNLTKYNVWANNKFIENLQMQDEKILDMQLQSSFPTILDTCKHMWLGELGWLSRMKNLGWKTDELDTFAGSPNDLFKAWQNTSREYIKFTKTENLETETKFAHDEFEYSIKRSDIILTIINHGNYHRGQIVTMLRQLGVKQIPKTDYIEWVREQERNNLV